MIKLINSFILLKETSKPQLPLKKHFDRKEKKRPKTFNCILLFWLFRIWLYQCRLLPICNYYFKTIHDM